MTTKKVPMKKTKRQSDPTTPCTGQCRLVDNTHCGGCLRTRQEIAQWSGLSMSERMALMQEIKERRPPFHNCPKCGSLTTCDREAGFSGANCWCMEKEPVFNINVDYGEVCLCRRCLTHP